MDGPIRVNGSSQVAEQKGRGQPHAGGWGYLPEGSQSRLYGQPRAFATGFASLAGETNSFIGRLRLW